MKNFEIEVQRTVNSYITVQANNENEATDIAWNLAEKKGHDWFDYFYEVKDRDFYFDVEFSIDEVNEVPIGYSDCCRWRWSRCRSNG